MTSSVKKIIPKTLVKNFTDYSNQTSIHGVKYLSNRTRLLPDRIFWIIIFILSTSCLGYFVSKIGRTWMDNAVMITDQTEPTQIFEIPFPAITICPQIKTKRDQIDFSQLAAVLKKFPKYSDFKKSDYGKKFLMASQVCDDSFDDYTRPIIENATNDYYYLELESLPADWIKALQDMSPNFNEVFEKCEMVTWDVDSNHRLYQVIGDCTKLFSTIITNEGICFTFNTINDVLRVGSLQTDFQYHNITQRRDGWEPEKGYNKDNAYPFTGIMASVESYSGSGLKFVLNANLTDTTPFCWPQDIGYKITLHSPSAYPHMYNNYILLEYGKKYEIAAVPQTIETSDDLRSLTPEERRCFFNDERKLKFYTFYNEENCRLECYSNFIGKWYSGVPFSSPRNSNTTNFRLKFLNEYWELPTSTRLLQERSKKYKSQWELADFYMQSIDKHFNCNCLPECNSIKYGNKILKSHTVFSGELNNTVDMNVRSAQTTIRILFNEPTFIGQQRVRVYTFETLISDFGGLLGLFMGGSLLSFFEIIYFLTIRICFKHKEDTATNELNYVSCLK